MAKKGLTFISVLISFFILAIGILYLVRVYPTIDKLSARSKQHIITSQIADKLFTLIEEIYGNVDGPPVPSFISGVYEKDPLYTYTVSIEEAKQGFYRVDIEIISTQEGKSESRYFSGSFRRR